MNYTNPADSTDIILDHGIIRFDGYEEFKHKAEEARDYLITLDVNLDSEKECKRVVAAARKIADQLTRRKIDVKRQLLEPYSALEDKVEEIINIISEGENVARDKLKDIDRRRREMKKEEIRTLWDARSGSFLCGQYLSFEDFLRERHLNKTVPLSEVEKEMVRFLVTTSDEIEYLSTLSRKDEYIAEYKKCLSIASAISAVDARHEQVRAVAKESYMVVRITGKADVILAKQLLKDVNYKIMEEN